MNRSRGFTLLEMMLAIVITAALSAMAYQAIQSAASSRDAIVEANQRLNRMDRLWQLLGNDLEHATGQPWVDVYGQSKPGFEALFGDRLAQSDASTDGEYLLRFTRSGLQNLLLQKRSELGLIGYRIASEDNDDGEPQKALWRDSWKILNSVEALEPRSQKLLENVQTMKLRYLLPGAKSFQENQWITGWPQREGESKSMPLAVEIELTLADAGTITRIFALAPGN